MQMFDNLPWYGYVIFIVAVVSVAVRYFGIAKRGYQEPTLTAGKYRKDPNSNLSDEQLFSLALDAVTTEWWKANTNTLTFVTGKRANNYLEGWGIDSKDGYWGLTNYFMEDGRRWYFDFIYDMMKNQPEDQWDDLMNQKFGENERASWYLKLLKSGEALGTLKTKGLITFDSEIEIGVAAYDTSVLVGHARRAYTANIISEQEAWEVIEFATNLAKEHFSSWEEFGKSYILGFTLDIRDRKDGFKEEMYHLYSQVVKNSKSPWNTINW